MWSLRSFLTSKLLLSSGMYALAGAFPSLMGFLMLPFFTRCFTPEDFGVFAMFNALFGITCTMTGLCAHGAIGRQYADRDTIHFPAYVMSGLSIFLVSSLSTGLFLLTFRHTIAYYTGYPADWMWSVLLISMAHFFNQVMLGLWVMQKKVLQYCVFMIVNATICTGLAVFFVLHTEWTWQSKVTGMLISHGLFAIFSLGNLWRKGYLDGRVRKGYVMHALYYGAPLIPHLLGMWIIQTTDRLMITHMIGLADTGFYVIGVNVSMLVMMAQSSFNMAWVPWFYEQLKKDDPAVRLQIVKWTYLYNAFLLAGACLFGLLMPLLLGVWLGEKYEIAGRYILIVSIGYAFNGMYKMVTNYLFYMKRNNLLACVTVVAALSNIVMNYILIKRNGPIGAAQATMLAFAISFILTWLGASWVYKMPWLFWLGYDE